MEKYFDLLPTPSFKLGSCIEGRIAAAVEFLTEGRKKAEDCCEILRYCTLVTKKCDKSNCGIDPWFLQCTEFMLDDGSLLTSEKGESLFNYLNADEHILCETIIIAPMYLLPAIERAFENRTVVIVWINRAKYKYENDHEKRLQLTHSWLLKGIDTVRKRVWISGQMVDGPINPVSFEELMEVYAGKITIIKKREENTHVMIPDTFLANKDRLRISINTISHVLHVCQTVTSEKEYKKQIEGVVLDCRYKVKPYVMMLLMDKELQEILDVDTIELSLFSEQLDKLILLMIWNKEGERQITQTTEVIASMVKFADRMSANMEA
ncbi:MAG: hypothetical protein HUJ69_02885 [Lachnospiraceae bacterium]|nr:hypothetical protein [Lachnospiraceae bacterium]